LTDDADQKRTLELLEANHVFPGDYPLSVIALNTPETTAAIDRAVEEVLGAPLSAGARESRLSSGGKYMSHRLAVPCRAAADVLRLYQQIRGVDGVVTVL
jgi:putative lipoic acid-binding regulatory protein